MSGKERKSGAETGAAGSAAAEERRRRQAEQLRANLLKRKAQSRNRADTGDGPAAPGDDPARD